MDESTSSEENLTLLRQAVERLMAGLDKSRRENIREIQSRIELLAAQRPATEHQARLATIYEASRAFGSSLDLGKALNHVMDAVIQLTGAERGFLMLINRETGELDLQAARNFEQRDLDKEEMQVSRTVITEVLRIGDGVVTSNAQKDTRFAEGISVLRYSLRSILCVPLWVRGEVIGVVYVDNPAKSGVFEEADREMLEALAGQAGVAIENARLYTKTDAALSQRVAELETLQQIDRELNTGLDLDRVLDLTLEWAIRGSDAERGWIAIRSGDGPVMSIVVGVGKGSSLRVDEEGNIETAPASADPIKLSATESITQLSVPVRREMEIIAVIGVQRSEGQFSPNARPFLHRLAEHAAVAIENTRLYRSVQAADIAKSQFVSIVTHELRMPMTAIVGYTDLLRQGSAGPVNKKQDQFLQTIRTNADRMELLVSDLSDISRIETGQLGIHLQPLSVKDYIRETAVTMEPHFDAKAQTLSIELPEDLEEVVADPARLIQILTNLLANATKYTPEGGEIRIHAQEDGDFVRVSVSDDGIGISLADQADLFSQFFRSDDPVVRKQQGWGLGLYVAHLLVNMMGGEIDFESELGKGSTFWFTLPTSTGEASESVFSFTDSHDDSKDENVKSILQS
ncbi:MAG: GAF domain-containing protein [Anaerolineales bacterium]|nr:GAF domain-containing protein [Anaerolineales bacterium]